MTQDVFTALADPTRRALLAELSVGERAVGELVSAVEASQPTVSKHLRVLRESGLVHQRAVGQKRFYRIEAPALLSTAEILRELAGAPEPAAAPEPEPEAAPEIAPEPQLAPEPEPEPAAAASSEPTASTAPSSSVVPESAETLEPAETVVEPAAAERPSTRTPAHRADTSELPQVPLPRAFEPVQEAASSQEPETVREPQEPQESQAQAPRSTERLDPLSARQTETPARPRGVGGLVSSVLRRRRR